MISIFQSPNFEALEKRCETLSRVLSLLIEGIRLRSVQGQEDAYSHFREAIQRHEHKLETCGVEEMLGVAGGVVQSMSEHARRTSTYHLNERLNERRALQRMIAMLSEAMAARLAGQDRSTAMLQAVAADVEQASGLDDLHAVKGRLETCLITLKEEKNRQTDEQSELRGVMHQVSAKLSEAGSRPHDDIDHVTGLPSRATAQAQLAEAFAGQTPHHVNLLRLDSLMAINNRYGRASGDEYFVKVADRVQKTLDTKVRLFRWEGATLLALARSDRPFAESRAELAKSVVTICRDPLMLESRSVILRISLSSMCLELGQFPDVGALGAEIDSFVYKTGSK